MYTKLELALADQIMLAFANDIRRDAAQGMERAAQVRAAHNWMRNVETQGSRDDFMEKFARYLEVAPERIRDEHAVMGMVLEISEANGAALAETKTSA